MFYKKANFQKTLASAILLSTIIFLPVSSVAKGNGNKHGNSHGNGELNWWRNERARRMDNLNNFLKQNKEAFESFSTAPLAIKQDPLNFVGVSMIVFRLLPEIFPEIWGTPEDKMANVGFGPDPFHPGSVMPLGQGYALSESFSMPGVVDEDVNVNYATFTCMGCHGGGVVDSDGQLIRMVGAAGPLGNFFGKINETVKNLNYTADNFKTAINSKGAAWIYEDPAMLDQAKRELALFNEPGGAEFFLEEVKFISNAGANRADETLYQYTYDIPNAPLPAGMPGSLDVFSLGATNFCDPDTCDFWAVLPAAPAPSDIPNAWQISQRAANQWDNSAEDLIYREVLASQSVSAGDPTAVNMDNVVLAAPFSQNLPAYPYPFDVQRSAAARGSRIYRQACQSCHTADNANLMTPEETGTDPNRVNVFTDAIITGIIDQARLACIVPECFDENGDPLPDDEILKYTGGYGITALDGIWASAPYLHNGSVPTLYHLLTGDRPTTFYRGNYTYDEKFVGFTWDKATNPSLSLKYDTGLAGLSNTGHTGPEFNGGIDWEAEPRKLWDLLEYMKTL